MTLEETFGSVKAIMSPEDFKKLKDIAMTEKVEKVISNSNWLPGTTE